MPARSYTSKPSLIEAIQWTGDNVAEVIEWTGRLKSPIDESQSWPVFQPPTVHGVPFVDAPAQLWVAANKSYLQLEVGEWIAKDRHGFYPIKDDIFLEKYVPTSISTIGANVSAAEATYPQSQR